MLPQTLLLLSLQLMDTRWPFPLLLNKCSNSTRLTELTSSRHPLKPAPAPSALLVAASRLVLLTPVFSFSFSLLPHPVTQLVLNLPSRSDGFKAAPAFPSSRPCSGPPHLTAGHSKQPPMASPLSPVQPDTCPLVPTIHPSISTSLPPL